MKKAKIKSPWALAGVSDLYHWICHFTCWKCTGVARNSE